jgi:predicted dehydrogenase
MERGKLRVGVIGAGLVGQVMHLPYLKEAEDLFEVRAVCDASRKVAEACAARFAVEKAFTDWHELLEEQLDAVLVLTSGSHAPIAVAAAEAGMHVFVEKPMCFSVAEGNEMLAAAERAGVTLMVGYPKRYDPAYRRVADEVRQLRDLRFVRLTTMESPFQPYVAHYPLVRGDDVSPGQLAQWRSDGDRRLRAAVGDVSELALKTYNLVLLDSMVHEFNLLRGILGEPTEIKYVSIRDTTVNVILDFDGVECAVAWVDLPGIARYEMEVCFYDPHKRVRLAFPSPFLRSAPTLVDVETGTEGTAQSCVAREVVSYEEAFKLELLELHRAVSEGSEPHTSGLDGLRDVALCENVIASAALGRAIAEPTDLSAKVLR